MIYQVVTTVCFAYWPLMKQSYTDSMWTTPFSSRSCHPCGQRHESRALLRLPLIIEGNRGCLDFWGCAKYGSPWIAHFLLRPQQELSILATKITALGRECYYSKATTKYFQHSGWSIMILIEGQFDCRRITISSNCLFSTNSYGDVSLLDSP